MFATVNERHEAVKSNCVSKISDVAQYEELLVDLRQIHNVVNSGIGLTPEARLEAGNQVRVKSGPFAGYEGLVVRREGKTRLLLSIRFLEQGVSMAIDEGLLEAL